MFGGGCEETTTGINRLKVMSDLGELKFPMIKVNDARCKHLFDNRFGTGQSTWDAVMRATKQSIAGKVVTVAGYGYCGKGGVALRAKGLGARVIIAEIDPVKALEAIFEGYEVLPINDALFYSDIVVTVTGCSGIVYEENLKYVKEGAILLNVGHFNVEADMKSIQKVSKKVEAVTVNMDKYRHNVTGKSFNILNDGKLQT